jgi:hypothetical protein
MAGIVRTEHGQGARDMKRIGWSTAVAVVVASTAIGMVQNAPPERTPDPTQVVQMQLTLDLPAVGNIDGVKRWRFGRLQDVQSIVEGGDVTLVIRTPGGEVLRVPGPAAPLDALARASKWVGNDARSRPTQTDFAERMIAFDVDASGRLIAMMSLEPMERSRRRLERVFGRR